MGVVGGVILDESVIFEEEEGEESGSKGVVSLRAGAQSLLRKLRHSNIRTGISYGVDLSAAKISLLKEMATLYSYSFFSLGPSSIEDAVTNIMLVWNDIGGSVLYLASDHKKGICFKLSNCGWLIVFLGSSASGDYISKLEEFPLTLCHLNRKAMGNNIVTIGYIMKPSREEDFAKRGAFPMYPTPDGLMFLPLTFELPISSQLQEVDVILHKATDEIVSIELTSSLETSSRITYTRGMEELRRYLEHHPDHFAIDPLDNIYPILDRLVTQQILLGLEDLNSEGRPTIRGPHFLKIDNFGDPDLAQRLSEAKLSLPIIVKPQVACGVADAHNMAIVFRVEDFNDLTVPLPAVIQEYVDHSSTLYKFYALGEKIFYAVKKSTPNTDVLMKLSEGNGLRPLIFDSLKSLPTGNQHSGDGISFKANDKSVDLGLVTEAANWLRKMLDLTIFGFDVVIQEGSGDHVIVDVNYLPSFKEVPDNVAIPAFWDVIKKKFESKKKEQDILIRNRK
ncbi:Ins134_P3_kin domain-containing protein [Cephalotus follicularis]|uniref:inositol-1,3,4-trisphosphate 5/6-kinase n=1 Tax=Cephalotus follicularis TaxID=3775 RepID=A0A1Q3BHA2_CEPFO|nr:Ins134_P3_kin domain-containing protein [Cephalotus follicularis]